MSQYASSFKRSRYVRRNKQRQGAQMHKLEGDSDGLVSAIRNPKGKQSNLSQAQLKIAVGKANDAYEVEADNVADKVVANANQTSVQKQQDEHATNGSILQKQEEEEAQAKPLLQKQEEEEAQAKPLLQKQEEEEAQTKRQPGSASASHVSDSINQRLGARKGAGQKMSANVQSFMQQQFQKDFSGVRIHTDAEAVNISRSMQAQAFALGKDVYFNQGKYQPDSSEGKRLLAHELTHVVQQNSDLKKPKSRN